MVARRQSESIHADSSAAAVDAVLAECLPRIYGYILLRVRHNATVAEDLTQETFLAWSRAVADGKSIEQPMAWLYGTARHKIVDHHRTLWTGASLDLDAIPEPVEPQDGIAAAIDRADLLAALDTLPDLHRLLILLRWTDGLSVRAIASLTGKTEHAIEAHLVRARRSLRQHLDPEESTR